MKIHSTFAVACLAMSALTGQALAQSESAADPACILKNSDGTNAIDRVKCPDGMKPAASATGAEATTDQTNSSNSGSTAVAPQPGATGDLIVSADRFENAKVMAASDFIGKRVYTRSGDDIGEVTDLIVTDNGAVQAVILGVGGFLGIGEKDVAVTMQAIQIQSDGDSTKLVVDASKEQLTNAPDYDRAKRTYLN
jgi:sporulation protein YlmC with PRC-barrel domain